MLRRAQVGVNRDAAGVRLHRNGLQPEPVDPRSPAGCDEKPVAVELAAVVQLHDVVLAVSSRRGSLCGEHEFDALAAQHLAQCLSQRRRLPGQHVPAALDDGRVAAETVDSLGHLHPDGASAQDQQPPRHRLHAGRFAVGPDALELAQARNRGDDRLGAVRQHHMVGGMPDAVDLDDAGAGQPSGPAQQVDALVGQPALLSGI